MCAVFVVAIFIYTYIYIYMFLYLYVYIYICIYSTLLRAIAGILETYFVTKHNLTLRSTPKLRTSPIAYYLDPQVPTNLHQKPSIKGHKDSVPEPLGGVLVGGWQNALALFEEAAEELALVDLVVLVVSSWEFPKIRGTLFWDPYIKDPTI